MGIKSLIQRMEEIEGSIVVEATKEIAGGRVHKAEPGGYGRKDDEDGEGKKVEPAVKRGRGRPRKGADSETGEVKNWDTETLQRWIVGSVPKNLPGKPGRKHKIKDESAVEEDSGVYRHKGTYGTEFDGDDEDDKKKKEPAVKRGRGRPRKDADITGHVPKWDTDTLSRWIVGSKPKTLPGKPGVKHKLKDWMEYTERQMISESITNEGRMAEVSMVLQDIIDGNADLHDVMNHPRDNIEEFVSNHILKPLAEKHDLHPVEDFDQLQPLVMTDLETALDGGLNEAPVQAPVPVVSGGQSQQATLTSTSTKPGESDVLKAAAAILKSGGGQIQMPQQKTQTQPQQGQQQGQQINQQIKPMAETTSITKNSKKIVAEGSMVDKLETILKNYPHEHKMAQEGWGVHESLYQALCDHYWDEGRIPRDKMYGGGQELRDWVEECYTEDTQPVMENPLAVAAVRGMAAGIGAGAANKFLGDDITMEKMDDTTTAMEYGMKESKKEVDESGLQAYIGKKKYGEEGMEALQKAGREGASNEEMAKLRAKFDKIEEQEVEEGTHTRLDTYRVTDPELIDFLSIQDGAEMEMADDDVGILVVDTITFPELASMASKLAKQKKIQPIAGHATRDITGKAVPSDREYISAPSPRDPKPRVAEGRVDEKLTKSMSAGEIISDFVGSDDPKFKGKSKKERTKMALGAYYGMHPEKSKKKDESMDPQMESWSKELDRLLTEGLTITTSTGNEHSPDTVSVNATDADAHELMKLVQSAGLGKKQSASMSAPGQDVAGVTVEPVSQDEVMGTLEPEDDGEEAFGFLKRMLGARGEHGGHSHGDHGDYEQEEGEECGECGHADCQCDHQEVDEMHNQTASPGDATQGVLPEELHGGQKELDLNKSGSLDAEDFKMLRAKEKHGDKVEEESLDQPATMEGDDWADAAGQDKAAEEEEEANDLSAAETEKETAMSEGEDTCNECGMYESKCSCDHGEEEKLDELSPQTLKSYAGKARGQGSWARGVAARADGGDWNPSTGKVTAEPGSEADKYLTHAKKRFSGADRADAKAGANKPTQSQNYDWSKKGGYGTGNTPVKGATMEEEKLNEWANSPDGKSTDEAFLADLTFMTKTISGGLNNIKQDQTVLPSTRVKTDSERADPGTSMAQMLKKLANIN